MRYLTLLYLIFITIHTANAASKSKFKTFKEDPKVVKILKNLKANTAVLLPPFKVVGDINDVARKYKMDEIGPLGRDYCNKAPWMPDRKRAIYCGANHAAPHRINDVWEFDLAANTWNCLYGPDSSKGLAGGKDPMYQWQDVELVDGILRTKRGGPALVGHTWGNITYDYQMKAMLFISVWGMSPGVFPKTIDDTYLRTKKHSHNPPMWAFYPESKKWVPIVNKQAKEQKPIVSMARVFEYIPDKKLSIFVGGSGPSAWWAKEGKSRSGTWEYRSDTDTWKALPVTKDMKGEPVRYDGQMIYSAKYQKLITCAGSIKAEPGMGGRVNEFDFKTGKWTKIIEDAGAPKAHNSSTYFVLDSKNDVGLLYSRHSPGIMWVYLIKEQKWEKKTVDGPTVTNKKSIGYYDHELNVFVLISPKEHKNQAWVYRYK